MKVIIIEIKKQGFVVPIVKVLEMFL